MSNPTVTQASSIADSAQGRASNVVPTNLRVTSSNMPLSVQTDVPIFPGSSPALTVTGTWMMAGTRVTANSIGVINRSSIGVGYSAAGSPSGPLQIIQGNQNVLIKF